MFATRQTLAAAQSSSMDAFLRRRYSRRASSATSMPILLRNLKQSATVFAGVYTLRVPPWMRYSFTPKWSADPEIRTNRIAGEVICGAHAFTEIIKNGRPILRMKMRSRPANRGSRACQWQ
jgi:hypothetical protein